MWCSAGSAITVTLFAAALAFAQTYPPGQYPPGTYPPNTYPLPGRVPIQVPIPEIKLPKRQPKDKDKQAAQPKTVLASVSGALRKLGEKDLLLQTGEKTVLRFRLLAKTLFQDRQGSPIRDSLLQPGDQLSVEVSPDDEETALRIVFQRKGSEAERQEAEPPPQRSEVRAPQASDLGKPRTVTIAAAPAGLSPTEPAPAAPGDASSPSASPAGAAPQPAPRRAPLPGTDSELINEVRAASEAYSAGLPDFLVEQVTSRLFSTSPVGSWQEIDVVTASLAYVDGKEDYRDLKIDGVATNVPPERTGSWSTGVFATTLLDILSPLTAAEFRRRGEDSASGRRALVFDYTVRQPRSHWTIIAPDGQKYNPAYQGGIWVDVDTRRVLRIEQLATSFPSGFPFNRMECNLDYGFARIEQTTYLLPSGSRNTMCASGSGSCTRNEIRFRNYRKFTADSTVKY